MKEIFYYSPHSTHRRHDIFVHSRKTAKYSDKSLKTLGHTFGPLYQKTLNLKLLYPYLKAILKIGLVLNANAECALFDSLYTANCNCKNNIAMVEDLGLDPFYNGFKNFCY